MDPTPSKVTGGFVAGDTKIALMDGHSCSIADVVEQLHRGVHRTTYALQADGNVHAVQIRLARREEGDAPVLRVQLDDGAVIHCSPHQLLLAPAGEWARAGELHPGDPLLTVVEPHLWVGKAYDTDLHAVTDSHRSVVEVRKDGERALYEFQVDHLHNVAHPSGIFLHD
jgi:hypothetical protein